jgi:hypothetical protein
MNDGRETDDEVEKLSRITGIYVSHLAILYTSTPCSFTTLVVKG